MYFGVKHLLLFILLGLSLTGLAQGTPKDRTASYRELKEKIKAKQLPDRREERLLWQNDQYQRALALAARLNIKQRQLRADDKVVLIDEIDDSGLLRLIEDHNLNAARTTSTDDVWAGGSAGLALDGNGIVLGIWEAGGGVRLTHQEFGGRVQQIDAPSTTSDHASHVAGTMIAQGVQASARGMANAATLKAWDSSNNLNEMSGAFDDYNVLVSNHSYGLISGWDYDADLQRWEWYGNTTLSETEDYLFGFYSNGAKFWDDIAFENPGHLIVKSAGNDRGDSFTGTHYVRDASGTWVQSTTARPPDGGTSGFDCITDRGNAKNILTVGAVADIQGGYTKPSDVVMSSFSGWGPTDDGRVKPDLVANGVSLNSSTSASNTSYGNFSGTSMSSPNISGSLALLQQHFDDVNNRFMLAATLKSLAIHTADDAGNTGPDYTFGWGLLNTRKAALHISNTGGNNYLEENVLANNGTYVKRIYCDSTLPLKVTLVWADPSGPVSPASVDPVTLRLVNDLDVRVVRVSDQTAFRPYVLDPANPATAATTGDNIRDNVEQIFIQKPVPGFYEIRISHKGVLANNFPQDYSLAISGGTGQACEVPTGFVTQGFHYSWASMTWTANPNASGYRSRVRRVGSNAWTYTPVNSNVGIIWGNLLPDTEYEFQVRSQCGSDSSAYTPSIKLRTLGAGDPYCYSYGLSFTDFIDTINIAGNGLRTGNNYGYINLTGAGNIPLDPGATYQITLRPQTLDGAEPAFYRGWIDYNKDNDFNDPGELLFEHAGTDNTLFTKSFTVPANVRSGVTRLRLSMSLDSLPNACGRGSFRDVEDYSVVIKCPPLLAPVVSPAGPVNICIGATQVLKVDNVCTDCNYRWSNGSTGNSIQVATASTYQVTVTDACGNTNTSNSVTLSLEQAPATPQITVNGSTALCAGQSTTLQVSNVCNGCTYSWSNGQTSTSINVNSAATYSVTVTNACGSSNTSQVITTATTTSAPVLTASGGNDLCAGQTKTITATNVCQGCTINWSNNQTGNSITVNAAGNYTATVSGPCGTAFAVITINGVAAPAVPVITNSGTSAICSSESRTLSVSNSCQGCTVNWSNNQTGNSITVNAAGTYTATMSNGCGNQQASIVLTALQSPSVPVLQSSSNELCPGSNVTITASNVCQGCTLSWNTGANSNSIVVNTAGVYTATVSNACGNQQSSITINASQEPGIPVLQISNDTLCPGAVVSISASNICSACTLSWSNGSTGTSINVSTAGNYTLTVKNACGQKENSVTIYQGIAPSAPVIDAGSTTICNGQQISISAGSICQGCSLVWSNGQTGNSITATQAGTYFATAQNSCGNAKSNVWNLVAETYVPQAVLNNCVLEAPAGSDYQWILNGQPIPGANAAAWIPLSNGNYQLTMTGPQGCNGTSAVITVNCITSAKDLNEQVKVRVYPNPAEQGIYLSAPGVNIQSMVFIDGMGRTLMQVNHPIDGEFIVLSGLAPGAYRIQVQTTIGLYQLQLIKI